MYSVEEMIKQVRKNKVDGNSICVGIACNRCPVFVQCNDHSAWTYDDLINELQAMLKKGWIIVNDADCSTEIERHGYTGYRDHKAVYIVSNDGTYHTAPALLPCMFDKYTLIEVPEDLPLHTRKYLTAKDIQTRLDNGEDPVELTIEKYKLLDKFEYSDGVMPDATNCPLCLTTLGDCDECPLYLTTGLDCDDSASPYSRLETDWHAACQEIISAMERYQAIKLGIKPVYPVQDGHI